MPSRRHARRLVAALALCSPPACSGEAVVGVVQGEPPEGKCLGAPQPVDRIDAATCTDTEVGCTWECSDTAGHTFGVECDDQTCRCTYDGGTVCVCAVNGAGSICKRQLEACCPAPWVVP